MWLRAVCRRVHTAPTPQRLMEEPTCCTRSCLHTCLSAFRKVELLAQQASLLQGSGNRGALVSARAAGTKHHGPSDLTNRGGDWKCKMRVPIRSGWGPSWAILIRPHSMGRERVGEAQRAISLPLVSPWSCRIRASTHGFIPWQLGSIPECPDTLLLKLPTSSVSGRLKLRPSSLPAWFTAASEEPRSSRPLSRCGEQSCL